MKEFDKQRHFLMDVFKSPAYIPMKKKDLEILLDVPKDKRAEFADVLAQLVDEGQVEITKRGKYQIPENRPKFIKTKDHRSKKPTKAETSAKKQSLNEVAKRANRPNNKDVEPDIIGRFISHKDGFGFIEVEGQDEDYFVGRDNTGFAMQDDIVAAVLTFGAPGKRQEARVVRIITHGFSEVVGTFESSGTFGFVVADSQKMLRDVFIPAGKDMGAVTGHKVVCHIDDYGDENHKPEGHITEILGHKNDPGVDILSIVKAFGIPTEFPEKVIKQASTVAKPVSEADMAGRNDLRDLCVVTIDGEDTKDIDDGVSLVMDGDNYVLGVHIADVTNYVQESSALDVEALKRGTSVYLADRVIPMLPHTLSNGMCSLNEGEDRLALSCIMTFDKKGNLVDHEICESVIHSNHRMTYTSVYAIMTGDEAEREKYSDVFEMIDNMFELSKILRAKRRKRGSIDFDFPETHIIIDEENGKVVGLAPYERNDAHKLIEDFMLAANETVAEHFALMESPFVYRVHGAPDPEKMQGLAHFLGACGYSFKGKTDSVKPKEIQKMLDALSGHEDEAVITKMTLRSMQQAKYDVECKGHFGLAAQYYCHFTSPIRRYPDLQIHRIIKDYIRGRMNERKLSHYESILPQVALDTSKLERRAEDCEREVDKLKMVQFMKEFIGQQFEGSISSITGWGMYVELENTVEGLVHVSTLYDDHYEFFEDNLTLVGERTGRTFKLGQPVTVILDSVDEQARTIDFILEEFQRF
ncbi:ribonuclease R [Pseudobutyrivibrio xylanivorans]|uniref:Ribonuclease R n=1 Tax=Pseudobutyrivibrio xylanivorans TaxID=185007 RepID=A0A5P6VST8_PSEXY|nr:ribonuclease R [Pseudobutyrivibrio xylanivorans]QFJ55723.1 ribonuclease R [Pseudobutyrivibrio xylanivorans]